jgi:TRAP-type C4-dicarboxylate transport system permease small subunit
MATYAAAWDCLHQPSSGKAMNKLLYVIEERVAMAFFGVTVALVFLGAISRTVGTPLTWAVELAQALFAWTCVLGADIALKNKGHIVIDILVRAMPLKLQTFLSYLWQIAIAIFLGLLVWLGIKLTMINTQRVLGELTISYAWITASIPAGAALMLISTLTRLFNFISGKEATSIQGHDGEAL